MDLGLLACKDVYTHAYVSSRATSSEGSDKSARLCRLAWASVSRQCDKRQNLMCCSICLLTVIDMIEALPLSWPIYSSTHQSTCVPIHVYIQDQVRTTRLYNISCIFKSNLHFACRWWSVHPLINCLTARLHYVCTPMYTLTVQTDVAYYLSWELEYKDSDPRFQVCVCVCGGGGGGGGGQHHYDTRLFEWMCVNINYMLWW